MMLGWKTYEYYYETGELPQPKANSTPRKMRLKVTSGPLFSHSKIYFRGLGLVLCRKQTTRNPTQRNSPQNSLFFLFFFFLRSSEWPPYSDRERNLPSGKLIQVHFFVRFVTIFQKMPKRSGTWCTYISRAISRH